MVYVALAGERIDLNMKRRIAMMLVLVMLMALILPQTALAVTRYLSLIHI